MKRITYSILAALMIGGPVLSGCERTVYEEKKEQQKSDGTTVTDEKKITESPDGTIKKTEEHKEQ